MQNMDANVNTIIISILIAIVTSALTVIFSFWRFQSERWWELKVETYRRIIELLSQFKKNIEDRYEIDTELHIEHLCDPNNPENPPVEHDLGGEYDNKIKIDGMREIDRLIDLGTFIISEDALSELEKFKKEFTREPYRYKDIAADFNYIHDEDLMLIGLCIENIKKFGRKDLMPCWRYYLDLIRSRNT